MNANQPEHVMQTLSYEDMSAWGGLIFWHNHDCTHLTISRAGGCSCGSRDFGLHYCTLITPQCGGTKANLFWWEVLRSCMSVEALGWHFCVLKGTVDPCQNWMFWSGLFEDMLTPNYLQILRLLLQCCMEKVTAGWENNDFSYSHIVI